MKKTAWRAFSPKASVLHSIPPVTGVYVIQLGGVAIYVGMSANIRARMKTHNLGNVPGPNTYDGWMQTPWGNIPWALGKVSAKLKEMPSPAAALALESRLIRRLQPRYNTRGVRRGR